MVKWLLRRRVLFAIVLFCSLFYFKNKLGFLLSQSNGDAFHQHLKTDTENRKVIEKELSDEHLKTDIENRKVIEKELSDKHLKTDIENRKVIAKELSDKQLKTDIENRKVIEKMLFYQHLRTDNENRKVIEKELSDKYLKTDTKNRKVIEKELSDKHLKTDIENRKVIAKELSDKHLKTDIENRKVSEKKLFYQHLRTDNENRKVIEKELSDKHLKTDTQNRKVIEKELSDKHLKTDTKNRKVIEKELSNEYLKTDVKNHNIGEEEEISEDLVKFIQPTLPTERAEKEEEEEEDMEERESEKQSQQNKYISSHKPPPTTEDRQTTTEDRQTTTEDRQTTTAVNLDLMTEITNTTTTSIVNLTTKKNDIDSTTDITLSSSIPPGRLTLTEKHPLIKYRVKNTPHSNGIPTEEYLLTDTIKQRELPARATLLTTPNNGQRELPTRVKNTKHRTSAQRRESSSAKKATVNENLYSKLSLRTTSFSRLRTQPRNMHTLKYCPASFLNWYNSKHDIYSNDNVLDEVFVFTSTKCRKNPLRECHKDKMQGAMFVNKQVVDLKWLYDNELSFVKRGGWFAPPDCTSLHHTAIIVPFRSREQHLPVLLRQLHAMLKRQRLHYRIFVIEQADTYSFNRAKLFNVGYSEALKHFPYDCFVFHDVDLIPENDRIEYSCVHSPTHLSVGVDTFDYRLPYNGIFGGVSAMSRQHFERLNGFSNLFWSWGGEDDNLSKRLRDDGLSIHRQSISVSRYTMLGHKEAPRLETDDRVRFLEETYEHFQEDGLSSLKYEVIQRQYHPLYTLVKVNLKKDNDNTFGIDIT